MYIDHLKDIISAEMDGTAREKTETRVKAILTFTCSARVQLFCGEGKDLNRPSFGGALPKCDIWNRLVHSSRGT